MTSVLVVGLTGQVGEALQPRLVSRFGTVDAVSRSLRDPAAGVHWLHGSLEAMPPGTAAGHDLLISLGPLDAFADWYVGAMPSARRVIALGSTGRTDKSDSPDAAERAVAARLEVAEGNLFAAGLRNGSAVTVLRPTLLYGNGRDQTLTPLLALARRWHVVPVPASATGLRQPVHVDDVASAILDCIDAPAAAGCAFDLPGGEALRFDAMVRRTLQRHAPAARVLVVPTFVVAMAARAASWLGRPSLSGRIARLSRNQAADGSPAQFAFGYRPGPFRP